MIAQLDISGLSLSTVSSDRSAQGFSRPVLKVVDLPQVEGLVQVVTALHRSFFTQVLAQALWAAGQGTRVLVVQFLKGGIQQGKHHPMHLGQGLDWYRCDYADVMDPHRPETITPAAQNAIADLWHHTIHLVRSDRYELVVLDELSLAVNLKAISDRDIIKFIRNRPPRVELILTGSEMPKSLLKLADQVTELRRSHRY